MVSVSCVCTTSVALLSLVCFESVARKSYDVPTLRNAVCEARMARADSGSASPCMLSASCMRRNTVVLRGMIQGLLYVCSDGTIAATAKRAFR